MITTRPATADDVRRYYPDVTASFRAWVAEINGVVRGILGIVLSRPAACIFSTVDDELKPHLGTVAIGRLIMKLKDWVMRSRVPVYAIAEPGLDTAPVLLTRLGFSPLGVIDGDNVYEWRP